MTQKPKSKYDTSKSLRRKLRNTTARLDELTAWQAECRCGASELEISAEEAIAELEAAFADPQPEEIDVDRVRHLLDEDFVKVIVQACRDAGVEHETLGTAPERDVDGPADAPAKA